MTLIKLPDAVRQNLIDYLGRKARNCEAILNHPERYTQQARDRAGRVLSLLNPVLEALKNPIVVREGQQKDDFDELLRRMKDLELKFEQLDMVVKKIASYHTGEAI